MQISSVGIMSVINYRSKVRESTDVRDLTRFINLAAIWLSDRGRRKMSSGARIGNSPSNFVFFLPFLCCLIELPAEFTFFVVVFKYLLSVESNQTRF